MTEEATQSILGGAQPHVPSDEGASKGPEEGKEVQASLRLEYDGPDYQGEMAAGELGTVLESLSDFVQAVGHEMDAPPILTVKVKAFREGSFIVEALLEFGKSVSQNPLLWTAAVGTAFRFYWKNMRRVACAVKHSPDRDLVEVTWLDGEITELTEHQWRLYNNKRAKKAARGLALPLRSGASRMALTGGGETVEVPAKDADQFEIPPSAKEETRRHEVWAEPDTISFDPDKKWRLTSRDLGSFTAIIEDPRFLEAVATSRVKVGKADVFRLALRTEVSEVDGATKRRHFIERVVDHHQGGQQDALPTEGEA